MNIDLLDMIWIFRHVIAFTSPWNIIQVYLGIVVIIGYICKILIDRFLWKDEDKKKSPPNPSLWETINNELEKRMKENKKGKKE
jgi:hypothetical protein